MKLSELNIDLKFGKNEIEDLYRELNNTNSDYPKENSIVDLFNKQVELYPDKVALIMDDYSITYRLLDQKTNRIANFLLQEGVTSETAVGLYLDRSIDLIICIFGVLKAGGAYLPLNVEYPEKQCLYMLEKARATFLIGQKSHIRTLNQLQWECESLESIVCLDSEDIHSEKELRNNLMKDLWEYVQDNTDDDIAKGGWMSSYTGEVMSREEMNEYSDNVYKKLSPHVSAEKKVLEVGCSSGLTMYRIAPQVKTYYGTDISKSIIDWNKKQCDEKGISNIKLECIAAEDIHQINEKDFDIIIFNSVVQVLSGFNSLRDVLRKAISMLSDKGILFFGDIMDLGLKTELIQSLHQFKRENNYEKTKLTFDDELFVPKSFFDDQKFEISGVKQVTHSEKIHSIKNELTEFRYDTILEVNKSSEATLGERSKKQFDLRNILQGSVKRPGIEVKATQLSNIMYTSGSTGAPKGVMIEHRSNVRTVVNSFLGVRPEDRWLQTAEVSFDPSCQEIFGVLLNGATLCLIEKEKLIDPDRCQEYFKRNSISILQLVTALFHHLGDTHPAMFNQVRKLVVGGDVLSKRIVDKVKKKAENLEIVNAYGPTENCIISTVFTVEGSTSKIPIGKPISNSGVYILDSKGELLPDGMAGELYVFGDGLARGYINDKDLTDERFLPNHISGKGRMYRTGDMARLTSDLNVEFLGRQDNQVKINGKRVELQEIEEVLKEVLQIDQILVMLYEREGVSFLCAYLIVEIEPNEENLKSMFFSKLPDHMIPRFFVTLDEFPKTTNGKIDKKALPIPDFRNTQINNFTAPRNKAEMKLAELFRQILKIDHVSVDHNFFKIGGHSLLATQVISQINQRFGVELELKTFFSQPTVEKLAVVISGLKQTRAKAIEPVKNAKFYEPSQAQKRLWILEHFEEEKAAYNISDAFLIKGEVNTKAFEDAVNLIIDRYEILRTVFVTDDNGSPMQRVIKKPI
ncbi:MAG: amino acid adenylation domain-containing protein, partial [Cyclobacteriaceae bacterium]